MQDNSVYLVFSKIGTWLSEIIYFFSGMKYPHSSISLDDSFEKMYSFGRTNPNNPLSGGFVIESLYEGVYKKFIHSTCLIYKIKLTEEQYNLLIKEIERFSQEKTKYRYSILGLFGVVVHKPVKRKYHYFCSQFVSEVLMNSNVYYSSKKPELIRTSELYAIENKELIYEGLINQFKNQDLGRI